jgi:hypothetical protein
MQPHAPTAPHLAGPAERMRARPRCCCRLAVSRIACSHPSPSAQVGLMVGYAMPSSIASPGRSFELLATVQRVMDGAPGVLSTAGSPGNDPGHGLDAAAA